jgi:mannose-6-phosphate isomerase-like protein (cupin superfamily)
MNIHPFHKDQITKPLHSPTGETLYELIGRAAEHGGATLHSLAQVVVPPGKSSEAHHHHVCEETYYVLRGHARMHLDERQFSMTPGQACLILPGQVHQIFNDGTEDMEFLAICAPAWYPDDTYHE